MRLLYSTVSAGMLVLAVAACGQPTASTGPGQQPSAPPATPEPVQVRTPVPDSQVDYSSLPPGFPHEVWTQDDGTAVGITAQEGGCGKVHGEVADQQSGQVTIALVNEIPAASGMCPMNIHYVPVAVRLAAPLNQRKVVLEEREVKVSRPG